MDPISGFDIRLVFTLPPRDSTLQYKRCVHSEITFLALHPCIALCTYSKMENSQVISRGSCCNGHAITDPGNIGWYLPSSKAYKIFQPNWNNLNEAYSGGGGYGGSVHGKVEPPSLLDSTH